MSNLRVSIMKPPIIGASIIGALKVVSSIMGTRIARAPIMKRLIMGAPIIDALKVSVPIMGTLTLHAPIMSCSQRAVQFERGTLLRILGGLAPTNRILVGA